MQGLYITCTLGTKMKQKNINSPKSYSKYKIRDLIFNDNNSIQYFSNLRWNGKKTCPRCGCYILYNISPNRYGCKKCTYKFNNFTGTYLSKLRIKPSLITHLLYFYVNEKSAYTISKRLKCLKCHISTIERTFRVFRQTIYDNSLQHIHQELKLYRKIGLNEEFWMLIAKKIITVNIKRILMERNI